MPPEDRKQEWKAEGRAVEAETVKNPDNIQASPVAILEGVANGDMVFEFGQKFEELNAAIRKTGKAGSISIKLTLKPRSRMVDLDQAMIEMHHAVNITKPEGDRDPTIYYTTGRQVFSRQDPRQMEMFEKK